LFSVGPAFDAARGAAVQRAGAAAVAALAPYATGSAFVNFTDEATDPAAFYGEQECERLQAVRAAVDPAGRTVGNHPIPPA
jgi:berberine-like enzyme